jgi:ParB family transcriptional regulator, chromosome partitioning protein
VTGKIEKRGLGRGLSSLMSDVNLSSLEGSSLDTRADFFVPIESLEPNPQQPRIDFGREELLSLADSIRQKGVIQPLIVRPRAEKGKYEIVAGERRWRAAQMAQLHEIPVIVRDLSDSEVLEVAIIENIQRQDLNAIEEALGFRQLMSRFGHTQEKLAEALSRSRSHVANLLRLLSLPDEVQSMVRSGTLSAGHARALISSPNALDLAKQVVGKGLSVRDTEEMVRKAGAPRPKGTSGPRGRPVQKDADTLAIEADLSANLRMNVRIDHEPGGDQGQLTIRYNTLDDLDMLCRVLSLLPRDANTSEF